MFIKSLSIAATLTLGLTAGQSAFALDTPEDGQDTCLIGTKVAAGKSAVDAMLEAIATCDASIETIIKAAITAAPNSSAELVEAAMANESLTDNDRLLIIKTAKETAPTRFEDKMTVIALVNNIDYETLTFLNATAAGIEDTTVATETPPPTTTETAATTTVPTTTSPTPTNGGVSPS